jgi:hypothetical protein
MKPLTYARWQYWLARKWETTAADKAKIIGVATVLASFGKNGANIYPGAETLAKQLNVERQAANNLRTRCIELGLFEVTGSVNRVPILRLAIPVDGDINNLQPPKRPEKIDGHSPTNCDCQDCSDYMWRFIAHTRARERLPKMAREREERKRKKRPEPAADGKPPW